MGRGSERSRDARLHRSRAVRAVASYKGISEATTVVFYGDKNNWWATYAFWVFQLFGFDNAKILMRKSGGWAAAVSDAELVAGIRLLAESTGIFAETAGRVTVAAALALARQGRFTNDNEVVLCITGNGLKTTDTVRDVLRLAPVIEAKGLTRCPRN